MADDSKGNAIKAPGLQEWATYYEISLRQAFRWQTASLEKMQGHPPFQDPPAMIAWWGRCFKNRVSSKITKANAKWATGARPSNQPSQSPPDSSDSAPDVTAPKEANFDFGELNTDLTTLNSISVARMAVADCWAIYQDARTRGALGELDHLRQNLQRSQETLSKLESRSTRQLQAEGALVLASEVQARLLPLLKVIPQQFSRTIETALLRLLTDQLHITPETIRAAVSAAQSEACTHITNHLLPLTTDEIKLLATEPAPP